MARLRRSAGRTSLSARLRHGEAGFTMIEVIVAILIFAILIGGVALGMGTALDITRNNRNRAIAANLASQEMDTVRSTDFTTLPLGEVQNVQSVDGVAYTVSRQSEWVTQNATSGPCQAPPGSNLAYLRVTVSVTWTAMHGVAPVTSQTVVTPPVGTYDATTGHVAVSVINRSGGPQEGVTVTLAGPVNATETTTADGCAFFAYKTPGIYTVTAGKTGYVSDQGVPTPSQPATVTASATASIQFLYDAASTLSLNLTGATGGVAPSNLPLVLANPHILPKGLMQNTGTGNPRTVPGLFPWLDGYQVWAGDCADADPDGQSAPGVEYYPGAQRPDALSTTPGGTTTAAVTMHEVHVMVSHVVGGTPTPVPNSVIVATHAAAPGCTSGHTYTLGTTDATGTLLAALPYGTWSITADGVSGGSVTLSPLAAATPIDVSVVKP